MDRPLPQAASGIYDEILQIALPVFIPLMAALLLLGMAIAISLQEAGLWGIGSLPVFILGILAILVTGWMFVRADRMIKRLRLGARGERVVASYLDELRVLGYLPFHDIPGQPDPKKPQWNIDHVIIGPAGIFAIETKTYSVPAGENKVIWDGKSLRIPGTANPERCPVEQAKSSAKRIREIIGATVSKDRQLPIFALLVFPGRFVEESGQPKVGPLPSVLNPKRLSALLRRAPRKLSDDDIALYRNRLEGYIREVLDRQFPD